jgi:hypothetical protein
MQTELVVHAYGPFYACLLARQLRSLAYIPNVTVTVCHANSEAHVIADAVEGIQGVDVRWLPLELPQLLNRAIGRNLVAKSSHADWVWFTDCDYLFSRECVASLAKLDPHKACMYYPQTVQKSVGYFDDDPYAEFAFEEAKNRKAIGGIQIVPGGLARLYGYLDGIDRCHVPAVGDRMYNPHEDHIYRNWLIEQTGLPIVAAAIPGVYRLRHRIPTTSTRHHLLPLKDGTETPHNADAPVP